MITKAAAHTRGFKEDTPTNTLAAWMGIKPMPSRHMAWGLTSRPDGAPQHISIRMFFCARVTMHVCCSCLHDGYIYNCIIIWIAGRHMTIFRCIKNTANYPHGTSVSM